MATIKLNNVSIATETAGAAALTVPSIQQTDAQNISGTKASHEMFMGKTFTLTGDLTVNDNLVFANLTGGGADITITDDGNGRTITTGSAGTLEGGEFLGTVPPPTDISTMTSGAIASAITGSPALNLSNATNGQNISNISKWTVTAFTASGTTYITGWSSTTVSLTEASIPTVSGTVFTFPTTGFWEITGKHSFAIASSTAVGIENITIALELSTNSGVSYTTVGGAFGNFYCPANDWFREQPNFQDIIDVLDVSTYRVRFRSYVYGSSGLYQYQGGDTNGETMFRKLGET
jgi:hypothetical protein